LNFENTAHSAARYRHRMMIIAGPHYQVVLS
jgi:hypothetical protein